MKVLFLDDSFLSTHNYQGYGGFCVDADKIRELSNELQALKKNKGIPWDVELKWSPPKNHYLRKKFKGSRQELYRDALRILRKFEARLFCVIHDLSKCYGMTMYGWTEDKTKLWAAKEQLKYLAERFQHTYLENEKAEGLIISDNYASRKGEKTILKQATEDLITGTFFQKLDRVSMVPLMADSKYCFPIQLADLVVGITVSFFAGGKYALELFPEIVELFAYNPYRDSISFASTFSASVVGVGIKLFPEELKKDVKHVLDDLDSKYLVTKENGIHAKREKDTEQVIRADTPSGLSPY